MKNCFFFSLKLFLISYWNIQWLVWWWVHSSPLLTSGLGGRETVTGTAGNDPSLTQKVTGELVVHASLVWSVSVMIPSFSADCQNYLMLFRKHVSRTAAGKERAVLEGVWLDAPTIEACFVNNPKNVEEAVQAGLTKWAGGKGCQPPTWGVLVKAMEYAEIDSKHIQDLKASLGLQWRYVCMYFCVVWTMHDW